MRPRESIKNSLTPNTFSYACSAFSVVPYSPQGDEFAFESIDYDHTVIATPSQNTANTGPPRMVSG